QLVRPESRIWWVVQLPLWKQTSSYYKDMMAIPEPNARNFANVFLGDYNDPFSASNRPRWFELLGVEHETTVWHSRWSEHGYPFSSLDVNFGPARLYLIRRKSQAAGVPGQQAKPRAGSGVPGRTAEPHSK